MIEGMALAGRHPITPLRPLGEILSASFGDACRHFHRDIRCVQARRARRQRSRKRSCDRGGRAAEQPCHLLWDFKCPLGIRFQQEAGIVDNVLRMQVTMMQRLRSVRDRARHSRRSAARGFGDGCQSFEPAFVAAIEHAAASWMVRPADSRVNTTPLPPLSVWHHDEIEARELSRSSKTECIGLLAGLADSKASGVPRQAAWDRRDVGRVVGENEPCADDGLSAADRRHSRWDVIVHLSRAGRRATPRRCCDPHADAGGPRYGLRMKSFGCDAAQNEKLVVICSPRSGGQRTTSSQPPLPGNEHIAHANMPCRNQRVVRRHKHSPR